MPKLAFPLRLSPFEEYLLLDDRPSFPMNFFLGLTFDGRLCYDVWNSAIRKALALHPLLHANVEKTGKNHFQWTRSLESPPQIELQEPSSSIGTYIDIERQTGLRITGSEVGDSEFSLLFQFHHSCCDGHGASQFINDVLLAYSQLTGGFDEPSTSTFEVEPNLSELRRRSRFGLTPLKFAKVAPRQAVGLLGVRQFMMRKPQPLIDNDHIFANSVSSPPNGYPSRITHRFSVDQTQHLLQNSKRRSVTLNDLVARDLLLSIDEFMGRSQASNDHWLRLTVPVSLRRYVSAEMPAANVLSFVFLERRRRDMDDPEQMLTSLNREMKRIKRNQLGLTFVMSLAAARRITGSLAGLMPNDEECLATAVLTNPGILFGNSSLADQTGILAAGDLRLTDVEFIAPFRPNTCAAFSVYTYARQLRITTHFDSRVLGAGDAERLHSIFVRRVSKSMVGPACADAVNQS